MLSQCTALPARRLITYTIQHTLALHNFKLASSVNPLKVLLWRGLLDKLTSAKSPQELKPRI